MFVALVGAASDMGVSGIAGIAVFTSTVLAAGGVIYEVWARLSIMWPTDFVLEQLTEVKIVRSVVRDLKREGITEEEIDPSIDLREMVCERLRERRREAYGKADD